MSAGKILVVDDDQNICELLRLYISECVMMFLIQLVPVLGLIMAAVWSFSPNSGINKRTISRALLIVQCIVLAVVCVFWCINYGFHG